MPADVDLAEVRELVAEMDACTARAAELKGEIISLLPPNADIAMADGRKVFSYRPVMRSRFSTAKFREAFPEQYDDFMVTTASYTLRINRPNLNLLGDDDG